MTVQGAALPGDRMTQPFRSFVPDPVARALLDHQVELMLPVVERLDAVVLGADLADFTSMSEALAGRGRRGGEELHKLLNAHLLGVVERVAVHGGSVAKFTGDG